MFSWFMRKKPVPPPEEPPEVEPPPINQKSSIKEIRAKVDSLDNIGYRSRQGSFRMPKHKLPYKRNVPSKVGSLSNLSHKPGGGQVKIFSERVDFRSGAQSRVAEAIRGESTPSTPDQLDPKERDGIVDKLIDSICSTVNAQNPWLEGEDQQIAEATPAEASSASSQLNRGSAEGESLGIENLGQDGERAEGWTVDSVEQLLAPTQETFDDDSTTEQKDDFDSEENRSGSAEGPGGNLITNTNAGGSGGAGSPVDETRKNQSPTFSKAPKWRY